MYLVHLKLRVLYYPLLVINTIICIYGCIYDCNCYTVSFHCFNVISIYFLTMYIMYLLVIVSHKSKLTVQCSCCVMPVQFYNWPKL